MITQDSNIILRSAIKSGEIEWSVILSANTMRGAKSKATRYIHRHIFRSDYDTIDKNNVSVYTEVWTIL